VRLPESLIRDVTYGQSAKVRIPGVDSGDLAGRVSEIAAQSGEGNAFRVAIALDKTPLDLRPGMAANATLAFEGKFGDRTAFLIPLSALAVQEMALTELARNEAEVFVFDPVSRTVNKRRIRGVASLGNRIAVTEGLDKGDHVVVAGVAFLHEGQNVALWEPPQ
jgi:hypothetical protein